MGEKFRVQQTRELRKQVGQSGINEPCYYLITQEKIIGSEAT